MDSPVPKNHNSTLTDSSSEMTHSTFSLTQQFSGEGTISTSKRMWKGVNYGGGVRLHNIFVGYYGTVSD